MELTTKNFAAIEPRMIENGFNPVDVKREISFALQAYNKSAQLQKCSVDSILKAVLNITNIRLSLNPAAKEAYLIPRWTNGATEAVLEPSYVGLVKLLTDAGSIKSITCQLVHEKDTFELNIADNKTPVIHRPHFGKDKGNILGAYALATLQDNTRQVEWMDVDDINAIRERSETYKAYEAGKIKSCTWVTDYGEMARKTVIKRIYKYLPRTEKMKDVDKVIHLDNTDYSASDKQLDLIESLLNTSTLDQEQRDDIELEMTVMNSARASEVIENLKANQQSFDQKGYLGSQKQTAKHIKNIAG